MERTLEAAGRGSARRRRGATKGIGAPQFAAKPQALGFTVFYLTECRGKAVSMLYPICRTHSRKTSERISRIWKYVVELPDSDDRG
jgi:hypothetical protein